MSRASGEGLTKIWAPGAAPAVDRVDIAIDEGETVALVGASGSGKSTVGRMLAGLESPTAGVVKWAGRPIARLGRAERRRMQRDVQVVFQQPRASLNPRWTAGETVREALVHAAGRDRRAARIACDELLACVGLDRGIAGHRPAALSGGQAQRVALARALAADPRFVVLDEPFSALDPIHAARLVERLRDLQRTRGLAYLFITHDFGRVGQLADRVAVMAAGRIVETDTATTLLGRPGRPETRALLDAVPGRRQRLAAQSFPAS